MDKTTLLSLKNERIKSYLNSRGITDEIILNHQIDFDGLRIIIPIMDINGKKIFNKYRKDPISEDSLPKYTYDRGASVQLYNIQKLNSSSEVIICEGEFDCLCLEANGFNAVTSTGGSMSFQEEWAILFKDKDVYVCFDNDPAGLSGIMKVCDFIPHAKYIPLPPEVGLHGDITDYFTKLKKTKDDFRNLMKFSKPIIISKPTETPKKKKLYGDTDLKKAKTYPIQYLLKDKINYQGFTKCPFHNEKTASMRCYPNNRFYCFGCGKTGDPIDIVMHLENVSLKEAIKIILKKDESR